MTGAVDPQSSEPTALDGLNRMSPLRQMLLLVAVAGSVALGVAITMWSWSPSYSLLYGSLAGKDAAEVLGALDQAGISYRVENDSGAILVPSGKVHEARLELAAQGLPKATDLGFELLDRKQSFGESQFIERARYQRALEVELARTIGSLRNVQGARVHLALPRQSSFLKDRRQPSASVLVRLTSGRPLEEGQASAIAHLVAAAVPNLASSRVRVVDAKGRLLTDGDGEEQLGLSSRQFEYRREVEAAFIRRIERILEPIVGVDGVRAQVSADIDFARVERSQETYHPDPPELRGEHVRQEGGAPRAPTKGAPASAEVLEVPEVAAVSPQGRDSARNPDSQRRESMESYQFDRVVTHVRTPSGSVRRLSVAVVVDDAYRADEGGRIARTARSPEELERFTTLVKDAIGFDAERGDSVNVVNAPFAQPTITQSVPDAPLWKQTWLWDLARQAGGVLLVILIALGVLRPTMRHLVAREVTERQLERAVAAARAQTPDGGGEAWAARGLRNEQQLDAARALAKEDPRRVANVVKSWVRQDA